MTSERNDDPALREDGHPEDAGTARPFMNRRAFLQAVGVASVGAANPVAAQTLEASDDAVGVLVDTTMCAGCLTCVRACSEANGLPPPGVEIGPDGRTSEEQFSIVNGYEHDASDFGYVFVKRQCMHCIEPACVSACLTKAMYKTEEGPVIWRASKCMGCRYCMLSCPVDAPKFEYDSPIPRIRKCELCADRLAEGLQPACVESCPSGALTFGRRSELLDEARKRISEEPDLYHHHIFGEHELGGTSWLYLASAPLEELGFREGLGTTPLPRLTKEFLYGVPVLLTLMPAFLLAVSQATKRERRIAESGASHDERGAQRSRVG